MTFFTTFFTAFFTFYCVFHFFTAFSLHLSPFSMFFTFPLHLSPFCCIYHFFTVFITFFTAFLTILPHSAPASALHPAPAASQNAAHSRLLCPFSTLNQISFIIHERNLNDMYTDSNLIAGQHSNGLVRHCRLAYLSPQLYRKAQI